MSVVVSDVIDASRATAEPTGWVRSYVRTAVCGDLACTAMALAGVVVVREVLGYLDMAEVMLVACLAATWPLVVAAMGGYDERYLGEGPEEYHRVLRAALVVASAVAIVAYATQTPIARGYVMAGIPLAGLANIVLRYGMRQGLHRRRCAGACMRRVVVVGHWASVLELHAQLDRKPYHGMRIVAACVPPGTERGGGPRFDGFPVLGDFSNVPEVVRAARADTVAVLACPELDGVALRRLAWRLEETDTDLYVASALMEVAGPRINIRPVAGLPLLHVAHPDLDGARQLVKGVFDKTVAALVLLALLPLLLVVAVLVRASGPGPVLFRQTRVGKGGEEFTVLKFRTMVPDAERVKRELADFNEGDGVLFKIRNDPRVTPVGGFLRRYSIDELP
ncbi:sugar transferase, partial [Planomonospora parontospora]